MKNVWVLTSLVILCSAACSKFNDKLLLGEWQGSSLEEEGAVLPINANQIQLVFTPNGTYSYTSTLKYKEAGTYYLDGDLLYRRDTLNAASREMLVEILHLDSDSLHFRMHENGRERVMKLFRQP